MTVYYLSLNTGANAGDADPSKVVEATSVPTADVYVAIGANFANLSRSLMLKYLKAIENYIRTDGTLASPVIAMKP